MYKPHIIIIIISIIVIFTIIIICLYNEMYFKHIFIRNKVLTIAVTS